MARSQRIVIPACIGCGAMHELERCESGCHEEHLQLVPAADFDCLVAAERSARGRIELALPVVRRLAERRPQAGGWQRAYESLSTDARSVLRAAGAAPASVSPLCDAASQRIDVWRCPECGGVDAPQECLGICIWRRFEWVGVDAFENQRARTVATTALERRLFGLLGRISFARPRADAWQRSWQTLSLEARRLMENPMHTAGAREHAHV